MGFSNSIHKKFPKVLPLFFLVLAAGCASSQRAEQEDQALEVGNARDGLTVCEDISPLAEEPMEMPKASALLPWVHCFETLLRRFESLRENDEFVVFFRSLRSRYDYAYGEASHIRSLSLYKETIHFAVERVRHRADPNVSVPELSGKLFHFIQKELPRYAQYLSEHDVTPADKNWSEGFVKRSVQNQRDAERKFPEFSEDWKILNRLSPSDSKKLSLSVNDEKECGRYRFYASRLLGLRQLATEAKLFEDEMPPMPKSKATGLSTQGTTDLQDSLQLRIEKIRGELVQEQEELKELQTHVEKKRACLTFNNSSSPLPRKKP